MANAKINGIILSESNLGDFDKLLTMLTHKKNDVNSFFSPFFKKMVIKNSKATCFGVSILQLNFAALCQKNVFRLIPNHAISLNILEIAPIGFRNRRGLFTQAGSCRHTGIDQFSFPCRFHFKCGTNRFSTYRISRRS